MTLFSVVLILATLSCNPARSIAMTAPANLSTQSNFNWDDFQPHRMTELVNHANTVVDLEEFKRSPSASIYPEMDSGYTLPSRVTVTYTGKFRQTPFHHMFALGEWVRPYDPSMTDEALIAIFKYEGRFIEDSASY
jgi:hypothetical protein